MSESRLHAFTRPLRFCCKVTACFYLGAAALQVDILGRWQVVMGESEETFFFWMWGSKVMCITRGRPIGCHRPAALHRLHSAPAAEAYLAPFIMHGPPPHHVHTHTLTHTQACHGSFPSTTLLFPLRGGKRFHNSGAARCFQGSSLIKHAGRISGGSFL